jgi:hypothetical protein
MKKSIASLLLATLLPLGASAAVMAVSTDANAQVVVSYAPPATYVARYHPYYYNGYATYYYGGAWRYYRPGYGWYAYNRAPASLCHYAVDYYGDRSVVCR